MRRVGLDFQGIDKVTASFADEVVGKLLVNLGPSMFASRIVIEGISDQLVRGQVVRTLGQRRVEAEDRERRQAKREIRRQRREARRKKR